MQRAVALEEERLVNLLHSVVVPVVLAVAPEMDLLAAREPEALEPQTKDLRVVITAHPVLVAVAVAALDRQVLIKTMQRMAAALVLKVQLLELLYFALAVLAVAEATESLMFL